jgi:hypothetical protein
MEHLVDLIERRPEYEALIQSLFDETFAANPDGFKRALVDARDQLGLYLAQALIRLSPHHLNYDDVAAVLLDVDRDVSGGRYRRLIARNFDLRGIGAVRVGPRLEPPGAESHAFSARTLVPGVAARLPRMPYRERWVLARLR